MKRVLISAPYMLRAQERPYIEQLLKPYELDVTWADVHERLEEKDLLPVIGQYNGVICGDDRFTENVYRAAKNLEVVVKWGTGIDSLNKHIADELGIKLYRTADAFTQPVADTTLAYILSFCRGVKQNDDILKSGGWDKPQGYSLCEKTVGLIGFGNIGKAVAKRLNAFGTTVLANDIQEVSPAMEIEFNVKAATKDEILQKADFISLHCDLNPTSKHLLNAKEFSKMAKKPYIINTSRGPVINESELVLALKNKVIAGAGLDVFEEEPLPIDSYLRSASNVFLASHNSNSSPKAWKRVHENSIKMLIKGLSKNA